MNYEKKSELSEEEMYDLDGTNDSKAKDGIIRILTCYSKYVVKQKELTEILTDMDQKLIQIYSIDPVVSQKLVKIVNKIL